MFKLDFKNNSVRLVFGAGLLAFITGLATFAGADGAAQANINTGPVSRQSTSLYRAEANPDSKYRENEGPVEVLTPENSVLLLIDHQVGLMNIVRDMNAEEFKNNVLGLAKTAKTLGMPVILTTSREWGPNGQLIPELKKLFPDVKIIARPGVINAYRWPEFREALEATGRKKVIIAAVTTTTCLQFPALDMVKDGYEVHGVIDASGSESTMAREAAVATMSQSGVKIRTWFSIAAELVADWRRDEDKGWPLATGAVHDHLPAWGYLLDTAMDYANGKMVPPATPAAQPTKGR